MSYNKYNNRNFGRDNNRNTGRYNTSGTFVTAGQLGGGNTGGYSNMGPPHPPPSMQFNKPITPPLPSDGFENLSIQSELTSDNDLETSSADNGPSKPHWMKPKLVGVKKISNKERRRRQNENLRRLLTPKNALMVLNEILPGEQLNNFKVDVLPLAATAHYKPSPHSFCAELCVEGVTYKGYGENKLLARNNAAEQAIRDIIIKRMSLITENTGCTGAGGAGGAGECGEGAEAVPMIQLASYALHKLFAEWEWDGHRVPQLRPPSVSESGSESAAGKGAAPRSVPARAAAMHPCMLLAHLRPQLAYRELPPQGDSPQNMVFSIAVDVDGHTFVGTASRKKEARKLAAKSACEQLFKIQFEQQ